MSEKKRSIFEEVGGAKAAPVRPAGGLIDRGRGGARLGIRAWLVALFLLVVAMIVVGGLTRLTDSGLAITEWRPVTGALPPMDAAGWQAEFDKYRSTPEFALQNSQMTLEAFKSIYWWEWGHRQLGRVIGLVWGLGFLGFLVARKVPPGWTGRLFVLGLLGAAQGAIGWWMVSSGLGGGRTDVQSYRLAVHLGLAFTILGLIAWDIFLLSRPEPALMTARRFRNGKLFGMTTGLLHMALLQILLGALVAGIDAGRAFPEWPLMAGQVIPPDAFSLTPAWRNLFENAGLVQFLHRCLGYLVLAFGLVLWWRGRKSAYRTTARAFDWLAAMLVAQVGIGIATVLHGAPLSLAILHQLGAVALWVLILRARFLSQYPLSQNLRSSR